MTVRLRAKARLVRRPVTGAALLLYPERALELNESAAQIVELIDGRRSVDEIAGELERRHPEEDPAHLRRSVARFIDALAARALLEPTLGEP